MNTFIFTTLTITLAANAVLLALLSRERASTLRSIFAAYVASIIGWTLGILLFLMTGDLRISPWIFFFATVGLSAQLLFALAFPEGISARRALAYGSAAVGAAFAVAGFLPGALYADMHADARGYIVSTNGYLAVPYAIFILAYFCIPIASFIRTHSRSADPRLRTQLRYLIAGFSSFLFVSIATNIVLPIFFRVYWFNTIGPAFSLLFVATSFYIIWRHRFLDIRLVIQRGLIYTALLTLIVATYLALTQAAALVLGGATSVSMLVAAGTTTIAGIFGVPVIEQFFRRVTDPLFFKDVYDYKRALINLGRVINESTALDDVVARAECELGEIFKTDTPRIILSRAAADMPECHPDAGGTTLRIDVTLDGKRTGVICLGEKRSGDLYTEDDRSLLTTFAYHVAVALERARLYRRVKKHARTLEREVARQTDELRRLHLNKRLMLLDIAHNLQTPLTVIKGRLDILGADGSADESMQAFGRSVDALSRFVYDLLKLAHLEATDDDMKKESVDLSALCREIGEYVAVPAHDQNIAVATDIEDGLTVRGNREKLEEALANLLGNAMKYMRPNEERRITLSLRQESGKAIVGVEDTGIGIQPEHLDRVFERFFREKRAGKTDGTGLGLAIVKAIVAKHGGAVGVQSIPDRGSTFSITIPLSETA